MGGNGQMSIAQYLIFVAPVVVTVLVVFGMKYISAIFQARASMANDKLYQTLSERAVTAQTENQAALAAIRADLTRFGNSLASVEKILQQVE
jgi:signal transduction histidine kinase